MLETFQTTSESSFLLHLWGNARLEYRDRIVPIRQKALAVLYYLALEGHSPRNTLAALLWDNTDPMSNLRQEIAHLRKVFANYGVDLFPNHGLLELPSFIQVQTGKHNGMPLEGLELQGASEEFELWLEQQRRKLHSTTGTVWNREDLLDQLATQLRMPSVVILEGLPGSERTAFALRLAARLGLPFIEGLGNVERSLRFLKAPYPPEARAFIGKAKSGVTVLARSVFGEASRLQLELTERFASDQIIEVKLPPLTWTEARRGALANMSFNPAAELYLESQGVPSHLSSLIEQTRQNRMMPKSLPPKLVQKVQLEARFLSLEARIAVERLSVHPGVLSDEVIHALKIEAHLDELERRGWLRYSGGWRFGFESVRRMVYHTLQPGNRTRMHTQLAQFFAQKREQNVDFFEVFHRMMSGEPCNWSEVCARLDAPAKQALELWLQNTLRTPIRPAPFEGRPSLALPMRSGARELALLNSLQYGQGFHCKDGKITIVRSEPSFEAAGTVFGTFEEPALIRLSGSVYDTSHFGLGLSGQAAPLRLGVFGEPSGISLASLHEALRHHNHLWLPIGTQFEYWFYAPKHSALNISTQLETGIIEASLEAWSLAKPGETAREVQAYPLEVAHQLV
jgi:hypothetical protein